MIKYLLKSSRCALTSLGPYPAYYELKKIEKLCSTRISAIEGFHSFPAPVDDPIGTTNVSFPIILN
jgi:hypothetical protein